MCCEINVNVNKNKMHIRAHKSYNDLAIVTRRKKEKEKLSEGNLIKFTFK